jgi:hypothetical protein
VYHICPLTYITFVHYCVSYLNVPFFWDIKTCRIQLITYVSEVYTASILSVKRSAIILTLLDPDDKRNGLHLNVGVSLLIHATSHLGTATTLRAGRYGVRIPEEKRPEPEFKHSPQSGGEVKNEWNCDSASLCLLYGVDRENLSFIWLRISCNVSPHVRSPRSEIKFRVQTRSLVASAWKYFWPPFPPPPPQ